MVTTSAGLAVPRSGVQRLRWVDGAPVVSELGQLIAAWQTPEKGVLKRVVIRCDGVLEDQAAERSAQGQQVNAGFPCAVLAVRYTIGGLTKQVLVDTICQSALVVWADSVDVEPVWDTRRIERLERVDGTEPCLRQLLAAGCNSNESVGDTGLADARWLDVIAQDEDDGESFEWSIHPVPDGARGLRILDTTIGGEFTSVSELIELTAFSADNFGAFPTGSLQFNAAMARDASITLVPPLARYLFLRFPSGTIETFDGPTFIEWIMASATLNGGCCGGSGGSGSVTTDSFRREQFTYVSGSTFVLADTPANSASMHAYLNGQEVEINDSWTIAGATITWTDTVNVLLPGDKFTVYYVV